MIDVISKPADQIGLSDIEALITSQVPEGEQIEFKESLPEKDKASDPWMEGKDRIGDRARNKVLEGAVGTVPPEVWNRLGTKILPKLRSGDDLSVGFEFSVSVGSQFAQNMEADLKQILADLGLSDRVRVERSQ